MSITCSGCGAVSADIAKFCSGCGKPILVSEPIVNAEVTKQSDLNPSVTENINTFSARHRIWHMFFKIFFGLVIIDFVIKGVSQSVPDKNAMAYGLILAAYFSFQYFAKKYKNIFILFISLFVGPILFFGYVLGIGILIHSLESVESRVEKDMLKSPVILAIKNYDKSSYEQLLNRTVAAQKNKVNKEVYLKEAAVELENLYKSYQSKASDISLKNFYQAKFNIAKHYEVSDPKKCHQLLFGGNSPSSINDNETKLMNDAMTLIISSSVNQPVQKLDDIQVQKLSAEVYRNTEIALGGDSQLLELINDSKGNYSGGCKASLAYMDSLLKLEPKNSAIVIRSMMTQ